MPSSRWKYIAITSLVALAAFGVTLLLININQRKQEAREPYLQIVNLTEDTVEPAEWGKNFPREYDGFKRTADAGPELKTTYGGSDGISHLEADPRLKTIFAGYAFAVDYREERGHAYSLKDQDETERTKKKEQPGACLQCHASIIPTYRKLGDGDIQKGFEKVCSMSFREARKLVDHPIACIDCHDPQTMQLRVTRPGFLNGIRAYMKTAKNIDNYDPNTMATRQEMRTFVCGQCHVEYYFKPGTNTVTYPWSKGLKVEEIEAYYDEIKFSDWKHADTGVGVLKAQHPEFELYNQGIHARAGVACADCHMPYKREGAMKVTDHHVRSPLLNEERACLVCHPYSQEEIKQRVRTIQDRNKALLNRSEDALVALIGDIKDARARGANDEQLAEAMKLQRKAQFRTDFINAENSMGFHASQEAARILAEAIDYARQGQLAVRGAGAAGAKNVAAALPAK
jgi:nitrite reductase (cytochrome c-552)